MSSPLGWAAPTTATWQLLCPHILQGPARAFQGSESPSAPPAFNVSAGQRQPCHGPRGPGDISGAPKPWFLQFSVDDQTTSARTVGLRWGGKGDRTRIPQLIAMEPPSQWDPYPILVPHHIPVTVQRGQAGNKMLCDIALVRLGVLAPSLVFQR